MEYPEFVEVDPTGRYGRYNEILGKGASKIVYRAFDEYEGMEVAWNQVKLHDFLQSPEDLERLYCEIHLLKTLKHRNIMKFYTSWVDSSKRNINFITEVFTSGTLRQYRQKHRRVNVRAVKHWCRQILRGLLYLHSHDPPIIHRDLKCDNIFINGNQGEVKIGDLGLAAILRKSHAAHCVGTPEFMAPEVYVEEYNELVDIYSFGMCVLEMVTLEYPYSECTHPVQIYKKVISGMKPDALYQVKDPEVRQFVEKCLETVPRRLPACDLLKDPFLQIVGSASSLMDREISEMDCIPKLPYFNPCHGNGSLITNGFSDDLQQEAYLENGWSYDEVEIETHDIDPFHSREDEHPVNLDITIKGKRKEDGSIFLRLRITENEGRIRNIYFPFDTEADTALSVATEMVGELDITDYDVTRIAEMIDGEVSYLVPQWKPGPGIEDMPGIATTSLCHNCTSNVSSYGSVLDYLSANNPVCSNLNTAHCSHLECAAMHGRFGEITYQGEGSEQYVTEGALMLSTSQSEGLTVSSQASRESHPDEQGDHLVISAKDEKIIHTNGHTQTGTRSSTSQLCSSSSKQCGLQPPPAPNIFDYYENEIHQELRWLKAKYQVEPRDYRNQHFEENNALNLCPDFDNGDCREDNEIRHSPVLTPIEVSNNKQLKSVHLVKNFSFRISDIYDSSADSIAGYSCSSHPSLGTQRVQKSEVITESSPEIFTAKSFYSGVLPHSLPRTAPLPVPDKAVDLRNY